MAMNKKEEARALSADELELVAKSYHPQVQALSDEELHALVKLMRDRRDKAQTLANRRRREMRGKAPAHGAAPSAADEGSRLKVAVLATAMRRLNAEVDRREKMAAGLALVENAKKALALKQAAGHAAPHNTRHAHEGMRERANLRVNDLRRPRELGRQRRAGMVAQAKRDGR
jgi:hypothetical protein